MMACSWELDALYYGTAHENERLGAEWQAANAQHRAEQLAAGEQPTDAPRPRFLDTTEWLSLLSLIDDPSGMPGHANPFKAVNFRLDVLRALATLPLSRLRAVVHRMDGYELDEIAGLMAPEGGRPWHRQSVRDGLKVASRTCRRHGDALLDAPTRRFSGVQRTDTAIATERKIVAIRRSRAGQERRRAAQRRAAA